MKVAVVGATGLVGSVMLDILEERGFPVDELIPAASELSVGKEIMFRGRSYKVRSISDTLSQRPDIALFSAGGATSLEWAPKFADSGTTVIDNSSAWRMDREVKLIVPEINAHELAKEDKIIANPTCSTIQMVMVLAPIHRKYGVKRVVVSTYQSVTGTGAKAVDQLMAEIRDIEPQMVYPYRIHNNVLPHCDVFLDNGYTKEEMKMVQETCKILGDDTIKVTATAVRVPVTGGHSESVNVECVSDFTIQEVKELLNSTEGISVVDDPSNNIYPMPLDGQGRDEVLVGRIRIDTSNPRTMNMWIVADNLRKGAATNAVQIAEYLLKKQLI
jgi:aspartate-semialdehyde dehydrogenase